MTHPAAQLAPLVLELLTATPGGMSQVDLGRALRKGGKAPEFEKTDLTIALLQLENESKIENEIMQASPRRRIYFLPKKGPKPYGRTVPASTTSAGGMRPRSWASALGVDL